MSQGRAVENPGNEASLLIGKIVSVPEEELKKREERVYMIECLRFLG